MRRILAAVAATLGLLVSAGQAAASGPADSALQLAAQAAAGAQAAGAQSGAGQSQPANQNISVRVQSPGSGGDVTQSNTAASGATASNANVTGQSAEQAQAGSCECGGGTQAAGQEASSSQAAGALSHATQEGASNENISVRVQSPGDDGSVSQSNTAASGAAATNANATGQSADQASAGGSGTQAIGQDAKSDQKAAALSSAEQKDAKNTNISVRVQSPGDGGKVKQENAVSSAATAANLNVTKQDAGQAQAGRGCECASGGTQAIGQDAKSDQGALAISAAKQDGASNANTPVRVDSKGDDGDVEQSNSVDSSATAANLNGLEQDADQTSAGSDCRCGSGVQAIGQEADSEQAALAVSLASQQAGHGRCGCPSGGNANTPVRVDSDGDGGSVEQSNSVGSEAKAANLNATKQDADQAGAGLGGIQAIGQEAENEQAAIGLSAALQHGASNANTPVSVDSKGDGGHVSQSNDVSSSAKALNANLTLQDADQSQATSCGCGTGIQAVGQEAKNEQGAVAASLAAQAGASNENAPVRVDSHGDGGSVEQSNSVDSDAKAANLNALKQDADQAQAGSGGIAIQAIGQSAKSEQKAVGLSAALQLGASNASRPVAVDSKGGGGDVSQSNSVESDATALNVNLTGQDADQHQSGRTCGCHGAIGIQAIGQEAKNEQGALAGSLAIQAFGRGACGCPSGGNSNTPVGVGSHGSGGSVEQSNDVASSAKALNLNALYQGASQAQAGGGTQAVGQSAESRQFALGLSAALQLAARSGRMIAI
jgi:hypothetical protein